MSHHLTQPRILAQAHEVIYALPAHRVEDHETLHQCGFIVAALPLFDPHMFLHQCGQTQGSERLHHQRHAAQRRQDFRQWFGIDFEEQRGLSRGRLGELAHFSILPAPFTPPVQKLCDHFRPAMNHESLAMGLPSALRLFSPTVIDGSGGRSP